jgi:DNA invertase Pin-like site-specific DNA recombinase
MVKRRTRVWTILSNPRISSGRSNFDRLSRSLKDLLLILERIEKAGAGFKLLTEATDTTLPAGRMMMQMLGAFAEFEREMIRERTRSSLSTATRRHKKRTTRHGSRQGDQQGKGVMTGAFAQ